MRKRDVAKYLLAVVVLVASLSFGMAQPVLAEAHNINLSPSSVTLTEGASQVIDVSLPEPLISPNGPGWLYLELSSSNPTRANVSTPELYFEMNSWTEHQTFTITATDDMVVNGDTTVNINYSYVTESEYYGDYTGSLAVTVLDNDHAPTITAPTPGQNIPAGSLMVTGTAAANQEIGVKIDGISVGKTTADSSGNWHLLVPHVSAGSHSITAQSQTSHHYAYMANAYTNSIDVIDIDNRTYVHEITGAVSVGATYNTAKNIVYSASNADGNCRILGYDPLTYEVVANITPQVACNAISMALSPDGNTAWLLYRDTDTGTIFSIMEADLNTGTSVNEQDLSEITGVYPSGIAITQDQSEFWIRTSNGIIVYDTSDCSWVDTIGFDDPGNAYSHNIVFNQAGTKAYTSTGANGNVGGLMGLLDSGASSWINNSYYQGDIELDGYGGGGLLGTVDAYTIEVDNSYTSGSITNLNDGSDDTPWTGAFIGYLNTGWLFNNFSAMEVLVDALQPYAGNGFIGTVDPDLLAGLNNYYNSDSGAGHCLYGAGDYYDNDERCQPISLEEFPGIWTANHDDAPLDSWSFGNIWHVRIADYPSLSPVQDPEVQCEAVTPTTTTLHVACSFLTVDGLLYGPTTWEMRYRPLAGGDWQSVSLPPYTYFDQTLTGLQPDTEYRIEFRHTDDRGVGEWLHIDAQTLGSGGSTVTSSSPGGAGSAAKKKIVAVNDATGQTEEITGPEQKIMLNDFPEFINGTGKTLDGKVGQVIYFMVGDEEHSATIKEIGLDYVIITLASTPYDIKLYVGQSSAYDVTGDGHADVNITLNSITNGLANLTFRQVKDRATQPVTSNQTAVGRTINSLFWIFATTGLLILIVILLLSKRSSDNSRQKT